MDSVITILYPMSTTSALPPRRARPHLPSVPCAQATPSYNGCVTAPDSAAGNDSPGPKHFFGIVPVFLVDDLVPTCEYYRDVLGFEVDFVYGDPPSYGSVSRGNAVLNFTQSSPPGRRNSVLRAGPGNGVDAYIFVTDVDDIFEEVNAHGALIRTSPASHEYGMREFKIEDRNGYIIVFAQEIEVEDEEEDGE